MIAKVVYCILKTKEKPLSILESDMKLWWPITEAMIAYACLVEILLKMMSIMDKAGK